ncbi:MAG: TonB-dependent siderophore receptor [Sphingomonas parapaucimobilis]
MIRWLSGMASPCLLISSPVAAEAGDPEQGQREIVITGERLAEVDDETDAATRTATPMKDIPQSIQIVPRSVIEDQNSIRLSDVLSNVSSVQPASMAGNRGEIFQIRGFATPRYAIDGVLLNRVSDRSEVFLDLANVQSVEVLKGPASVMYGQGDPGGVINISTRQPSHSPTAEIELQGGSFGFARASATASGAVTDRVAVRLTGAAQRLDGFRGGETVDSTRQFAAASARWTPGAATVVRLDLDHASQRGPFERGLVVGADNRITLPRDRFLAEPRSRTAAHRSRASLDIGHEAADWLTLRLNARHVDATVDDDDAIDNRALGRDGRTLTRRATRRVERLKSADMRGEALARFSTGMIDHRVLAGVNYSRATLDFVADRANIAAIDILAPAYTAPVPRLSPNASFLRRSTLYGVYLQDQVTVTSWLKLLGSVRHDEVRDRQTDRFSNMRVDRDSGATTFRTGIVVQPIAALSFFGGFGQSFQPQTGRRADRGYLDPERGRQWEAGVKADPADGRLMATASVFDIRKRNVATADPDNPGFSLQTGEQHVRGAELDITGHPTRRWQVIVSGSHLDATISRDETFAIGNRLTNVPRWSGRLWSSYILGGPVEGLTVAGGLTRVGRRSGDLNNSFFVDGYTIYDATISYLIPNSGVEFSVTGRNLTDRYFIESAVQRLENYPGAPRTIMGSLRARF